MRHVPLRRAVLAAVCLTLVTATAGACSTTAAPTANPSDTNNRAGTHAGSRGSGSATAPQPQQAYAVAQKEFGLLSGGGWAAAWNLWTADAQHAVPQVEFVRVNTACRPALGVPYVIDDSTVSGTDAVRVTWHRASTEGANTLLYQGGQWRFAPDARTLADYRVGADRLIRQRRAAGSCR